MSFIVGRFYEFTNNDRTKCVASYDNGWVFNRITEDFGPIANDGFVLLDGTLPEHKEIFRELKPATKERAFFNLAMKLASDRDINENYNGFEAGVPYHYEHEHGIFSELWDMPREKEKDWVDRLPRQLTCEDQWDDDEEVMLRAILVFRKVKEFMAEMNL
jgi:hypothetical protein